MFRYLALFFCLIAAFSSENSYAQRGRVPYRPVLISASASTDPYGQAPDIFINVTSPLTATVSLLQPGIDGSPAKKEYKGTFEPGKNKITVQIPADEESGKGVIEISLSQTNRTYFIETFQKKTSGWQEHYDLYRFNKDRLITSSNSISSTIEPQSPAFFENKSQYNYLSIGAKFYLNMSVNAYNSEEGTNKNYRLSRTFYSYDNSGREIANTSASFSEYNGFLTSSASYIKYNLADLTATTASVNAYEKSARAHFAYASQLASTKNPDLMNRLMESADVTYYSDSSFDSLKVKHVISYQLEKTKNRIIQTPKLVRVGLSRSEMYLVNGSPDILGTVSGDTKDIFISWPYPAYYSNIFKSLDLRYLMLFGFHEGSFGLIFIDLNDPVGETVQILDFPRENKVTLSGQEFILTLGSDGIISFTKE